MGISPPIPETAVGVTESTWIAAAGDISWGGAVAGAGSRAEFGVLVEWKQALPLLLAPLSSTKKQLKSETS